MRRVLFVAEAVTLAQVVRLVTLARALDPTRYEVHFASARFDELVFAGAAFHRHAIHSLPAEVVDARVAGGRRPYGLRTLAESSDGSSTAWTAPRKVWTAGRGRSVGSSRRGRSPPRRVFQ